MNEHKVQYGGALVYWQGASFSDHDSLKTGLTDLGLAEFTPAKSTKDATLKTALGRHFDNRLIRPKRGGYAVVEERRGEKEHEKNEYKEHYSFWLEGKDHDVLRMEPYDYDLLAAMAARFDEYCGYVTINSLTDALVRMIASPYFRGCTGLKPKGGVYWLPAQRLDLWAQVADVVERSGRIGNNVMFKINHDLDRDAIKAIHFAVRSEAEAEADRLMQSVMEDELGRAALENRQQSANSLLQKLEFYESILGTSLQAVKQAVGKAGEAAAVAALRAGGAVIGGAA